MTINNGSAFASHQINWKWDKGEATSLGDFGDPVSGPTNYRLCVYDESGGTPQLVIQTRAPAGGICPGGFPCWYATRRGYVYNDKELTPDGLVRLNLQPATTLKPAKILVRGVGADLTLPAPVSPEQLLAQDVALTVQLLRDDSSICWESVFTAPAQRNNATQFKDAFRP